MPLNGAAVVAAVVKLAKSFVKGGFVDLLHLLQVSKNGLDYIQSALEYFCVDRMRVLSVHLGMGGSSEELACFFKFRHPAGDS